MLKKSWFFVAAVVFMSSMVAGPVSAQTPSLRFDQCLVDSVGAARARYIVGDGNWWTRVIEFGVDVAACTWDFLTPF